MTALIAIDLAIHLITNLYPGAFRRFVVHSTNWRDYLNLFLYVKIVNVSASRFCAMFWEPGVAQSFMILALYLAFFRENRSSKRLFQIIIFIVGIVLTFSTTGYFALAVLILNYLLSAKTGKAEKIILTALVIASSMVFLTMSYSLLFEGRTSTFGKLETIFEADNPFQSKNIRILSVTKPAEAFLEHPVFGVGGQRLRVLMTDFYSQPIATCTPINWFAKYGIFYGVIMAIGYILLGSGKNKSLLSRLLTILMLFIIISSEEYSLNIFFIGLALLGYKQYMIQKTESETLPE
jgi:hypothetical protein